MSRNLIWRLAATLSLAAASAFLIAGRFPKSEVGMRGQAVRQNEADPYRVGASALREHQKNARQSGESLYFDFPVDGDHPDLIDLVQKRGQDMGSYIMDEAGMFIPSEAPPEPLGVSLARNSEMIVRGRVVGRQSFLNTSRTLVFTEYEVSVGEVLKSQPSDPVSEGSHIFFVRRGGSIRVGQNVIYTKYASMRFIEKGQDLLLFLNWMPGSPGAHEGQSYLVEAKGLTECDGVNAFSNDNLADVRAKISAAAGGEKR